MGGHCCCSARRTEADNIPIYFYYPPVLEDEPFPATYGTIPTLSSGVLVDTNLDTSDPDTYRAPPTPLPYDTVLREVNRNEIEPSNVCENLNCKKICFMDDCLKATEDKPEKLSEPTGSIVEEDACPICLEEYDAENPKMTTKCEHDFHLSCILEWMERSDTCPICHEVTLLDQSFSE